MLIKSGRTPVTNPEDVLLGAMVGAGTVTAALNSLKEESHSAVPAIGYTVCYAFGNVILTIWGSVIVNVM